MERKNYMFVANAENPSGLRWENDFLLIIVQVPINWRKLKRCEKMRKIYVYNNNRNFLKPQKCF